MCSSPTTSAVAAALSEDLRVRSQNDPKSIFWVVTLDEEIRNEMREAYRSQQMIGPKSRDATTRTAPRSSPTRRDACAGTWRN